MVDGSLPPGTRLPWGLRLAEYLGTSRSSVRRAYGRLVEEGLLDSAIGVGTWVKSGQVVDPAAVSGSSRGAGVVFPEAGRLEGEGPVPAVALVRLGGNLPHVLPGWLGYLRVHPVESGLAPEVVDAAGEVDGRLRVGQVRDGRGWLGPAPAAVGGPGEDLA